MKYTMDAALKEISARGKRLRIRRQKHTVHALSVSCLVLLALLTGTMATLSQTLCAQVPAGAYGALLLGESVGGYVLVAVAAFAAAVAVTLTAIRHRGKK